MLGFFAAELVRVIFFTKNWGFRFSETKREIKNWEKALTIMLLFIFIFPLINAVFVNYVSTFLEYFGWYQLTLFFILLPSVYLWIEKRVLSLGWQKRDIFPVGIILFAILITIII